VSGGEHSDPAVTFLGRRLPEWLDVQLSTIACGETRTFVNAEWRCALVVVERGVLELECTAGQLLRFEQGAALWLDGLPLRALHNGGDEPALLSAVRRSAVAVERVGDAARAFAADGSVDRVDPAAPDGRPEWLGIGTTSDQH
jgi:hypothetical protein